MEVSYQRDLQNINEEMLTGFFQNWPNPPSASKLFKILQQSNYIVIAIVNNELIGFINAISDEVLSAYIPLLEVKADFQGKGIGKQLVLEMEQQIKHLYMQDIVCDENISPFYEKLGYTKLNGLVKRNYSSLDLLKD